MILGNANLLLFAYDTSSSFHERARRWSEQSFTEDRVRFARQHEPRRVMKAHLAALTIEHGATLYTTDRDFARFRKLRVVDPLV